jgi:hypothetical protein
VAPIFSTLTTCQPPPTAALIGREMHFESRCGQRWRLEQYVGKDGSLLGPSLILL